jgi:ferredoxin
MATRFPARSSPRQAGSTPATARRNRAVPITARCACKWRCGGCLIELTDEQMSDPQMTRTSGPWQNLARQIRNARWEQM